jgi:hypothetical protein
MVYEPVYAIQKNFYCFQDEMITYFSFYWLKFTLVDFNFLIHLIDFTHLILLKDLLPLLIIIRTPFKDFLPNFRTFDRINRQIIHFNLVTNLFLPLILSHADFLIQYFLLLRCDIIDYQTFGHYLPFC